MLNRKYFSHFYIALIVIINGFYFSQAYAQYEEYDHINISDIFKSSTGSKADYSVLTPLNSREYQRFHKWFQLGIALNPSITEKRSKFTEDSLSHFRYRGSPAQDVLEHWKSNSSATLGTLLRALDIIGESEIAKILVDKANEIQKQNHTPPTRKNVASGIVSSGVPSTSSPALSPAHSTHDNCAKRASTPLSGILPSLPFLYSLSPQAPASLPLSAQEGKGLPQPAPLSLQEKVDLYYELFKPLSLITLSDKEKYLDSLLALLPDYYRSHPTQCLEKMQEVIDSAHWKEESWVKAIALFAKLDREHFEKWRNTDPKVKEDLNRIFQVILKNPTLAQQLEGSSLSLESLVNFYLGSPSNADPKITTLGLFEISLYGQAYHNKFSDSIVRAIPQFFHKDLNDPTISTPVTYSLLRSPSPQVREATAETIEKIIKDPNFISTHPNTVDQVADMLIQFDPHRYSHLTSELQKQRFHNLTNIEEKLNQINLAFSPNFSGSKTLGYELLADLLESNRPVLPSQEITDPKEHQRVLQLLYRTARANNGVVYQVFSYQPQEQAGPMRYWRRKKPFQNSLTPEVRAQIYLYTIFDESINDDIRTRAYVDYLTDFQVDPAVQKDQLQSLPDSKFKAYAQSITMMINPNEDLIKRIAAAKYFAETGDHYVTVYNQLPHLQTRNNRSPNDADKIVEYALDLFKTPADETDRHIKSWNHIVDIPLSIVDSEKLQIFSDILHSQQADLRPGMKEDIQYFDRRGPSSKTEEHTGLFSKYLQGFRKHTVHF